jgi:hypothetical protein
MEESNSVDFSMVEYSWEKKYFRNVINETWRGAGERGDVPF